MFEARLQQGQMFKKIVEAIRELVNQANFDVTDRGIQLQAMCQSHVSLVCLLLRADGFSPFRCDRNLTLGIDVNVMSKIIKCAANDDYITLKADDDAENLSFLFESPDSDKISDYEVKLLEIDGETLEIPETDFTATVRMPSAEFSRIVRDLAVIGDTVQISVDKEGVKFSASGDNGSGNVQLRQSSGLDSKKEGEGVTIEMEEPCTATFALRYLNLFTRATPLSGTVSLEMRADTPMAVEYRIGDLGFVKFFLAPKIDDDEEGMDEAEHVGPSEVKMEA